jgi:hypothetical protein
MPDIGGGVDPLILGGGDGDPPFRVVFGSGGGCLLPIPDGGGSPLTPFRGATAAEGSANSGFWRTAAAVEVEHCACRLFCAVDTTSRISSLTLGVVKGACVAFHSAPP